MNITSVSSNSYSSGTALNINNEIKMLEKQKEQLQDQIKNINESDMDDKLKQENIKLLKDQIQQIESLIQRKRSEKLTQGVNKEESSSDKSDKPTMQKAGNGSGGADLSGMNDLVAANSSISKARIQNGVKSNLESEGEILKKEIEIDEGRSLTGRTAERKREQLGEKENRGRMLEDKIADTLKNTQVNVEPSKEPSDGQETAGEPDAAAEMKDADKDGLDPLSWLLENGDKYKKVDTMA